MIQLANVTAKMGTVAVLEGLNLEVETGGHVVICGSSGSGKTTLLRVIAGLHAPDEGRVQIDGATASEGGRMLIGPASRNVAMVFQDLGLWPNLSVRHNVKLGVSSRHLTRAESKAEVAAAMAACRIEHLCNSRPSELSGGERQRVALARAVAARPRVLLLDEPFASLDLLLKDELAALFHRLSTEHQWTTITVTHEPHDALSLSPGRLAVLEEGRIREEIPFSSLLHVVPQSRLLTLWTRRFLSAASTHPQPLAES